MLFLAYKKGIIRQELDYCAPVWSPFQKGDTEALERVQRRAAKLNECKNLAYEDRLIKLGLMNLQERRCRGDLIQVFKIVKGFDKLPFSHFFEISKSNIKTRGHKYKLV